MWQEIYSKYNYHKKCLESERRIAIGTEIVKSGRKIDAQVHSMTDSHKTSQMLHLLVTVIAIFSDSSVQGGKVLWVH